MTIKDDLQKGVDQAAVDAVVAEYKNILMAEFEKDKPNEQLAQDHFEKALRINLAAHRVASRVIGNLPNSE
jgi:hypothetical protein